MGSWTEIRSQEDRELYCRLLKASHPAYAEANMDGINRLFDERHGKGFLYTEDGDDGFQLMVLITPAPREEGTWKVVNAAAIGKFDGLKAGRIIHTKMRQVMDEMGVRTWYGTPLTDYGDRETNAYYHSIPDLCWELVRFERISNGRTRYTLHRDPARTDEDDRFEGPRAQGRDVFVADGDGN